MDAGREFITIGGTELLVLVHSKTFGHKKPIFVVIESRKAAIGRCCLFRNGKIGGVTDRANLCRFPIDGRTERKSEVTMLPFVYVSYAISFAKVGASKRCS